MKQNELKIHETEERKCDGDYNIIINFAVKVHEQN